MSEELSLILPPEMDGTSFTLVERLPSGACYKSKIVKDPASGKTYVCKSSFRVVGTERTEAREDFELQVCVMATMAEHPCSWGFAGYLTPKKPCQRAKLYLEYYPNGTLMNYIDQDKLSRTQRYIAAIGICLSICKLNSLGVVHGDLKPQNVFIGEPFCPKVGGYSLAHRDGEKRGVSVGTPIYLAPEIWNESGDNKAVDIYAFAIVLYQLFVSKKIDIPKGYLPYLVVNGWRPVFRGPVSDEMADLIKLCWQEDPSERPTMTKVAHTLLDIASIDSDVDFDELRSFILEAHGKWLLDDYDMSMVDVTEYEVPESEYEIEPGQSLGEGGSGTVYVVRSTVTNEVCAGKRIRQNWLQSHEKEFYNEINFMAMFDNPCIVKLYGYTSPEEGSNAWIFMELMEGGPLSNALKNEGLTPTDKLKILYGVAFGMSAVHGKNIVHLDLKPDNVVLDKTNMSKITDSGISREKSMDVSVPMGTFLYMAPETASSKWGPPADVFSFAMILYEVFVSRTILPPRWRHTIWRTQVARGYRPPLPDTISEPLRTLIKQCWDHDPSKRPTFSAICSYLEEHAGDIIDGVDVGKFREDCARLGKPE